MARPTSAVQQRQLTLTEELEKLEQSITLTLQEIDHNFSRAHRVVTSSILPIVEQYGTQSKRVWDGSKFWKQFFESSANVSLSGYEEPSSQVENTEETMSEHSNTSRSHENLETSQEYDTPSAQHISTSSIQDIDLSNLTISPSHSTPRPGTKQRQQSATFADYPSPYEALRQEVNNTTMVDSTSITDFADPKTPRHKTTQASDIAMTPQSSPFLPPIPLPNERPSTVRKKTDPLLHRILDRNYRVQATPLTTNRNTKQSTRGKSNNTTPATNNRTRNALLESNLSSSPEVAPPELHAEIFSSPQRKPRTPGVSVLSPARNKQRFPAPTRREEEKIKQSTTPPLPARTPGVWDSEGEDEDDFDDSDLPFNQSPPKTIQFHIPQSRLLQTPAKEASKRIVDDLLQTAGLNHDTKSGGLYDDEDEEDDDLNDDEIDVRLDMTPDRRQNRRDDDDFGIDFDDDEDYDNDGHGNNRPSITRYGGADDTSPSVVRRAMAIEDQTF